MMQANALAPSTLAQWIAAIATSLAVCVALFKDEYLRYRWRPDLRVRVTPKPPDCLLSQSIVNANGSFVWSGNIYWVRLWVENLGTARAEQVQVFASKLLRRDANDDFTPVADFMPMNLRWANARDWRSPEIFAPGISRKMGKHCDLCSISDPANPTDRLAGHEGECIANLQLEVFQNDTFRLPTGEYILEIIVGAANADPVTTYVGINLTGKWSPDLAVMFREHLGVRIVSSPSNGR